jgi:hypothetical protein
MAKQEIKNIQIDGGIYAYGTLGSELTGNKTLVQDGNNGITKSSSYQYTIVTPGLYLFHAQQLMNTTGASNFWSYVNGVGIHHGWQQTQQNDMITTFTRYLNAGDIVHCAVDTGVANVWTGSHSVFYLVRIA